MKKVSMNKYDQEYLTMIVILEEVLQYTEEEILKKELSETDIQKLLLMSLMLSVMESVKSIILLLNNKLHIAIPSIFRNILEAHVDLRNLIRDSKYKNVMFTSYIVDQKKLLKNKKELNSIDEVMFDHINELFEIYKGNISKTKIKTRFDNIGLSELYFDMYNRLCRETHNNITCLIQRHFDKKPETEELKYLRKKDLNEVTYYIYSCIDVLHKSLVSIGKFFTFEKSKNLSQIVGLQDIFKEKFGKYLNND